MLKSTSAFLRSLGLTEPTIVVDEMRARANIRRMASKARASDIAFRPHFKTHQCRTVGRWFADEGVDRITVSSLDMAEYFAHGGDGSWRDITLAFLLNPLETNRIALLAEALKRQGGALGVTIDSLAAATAANACGPVRIWLKIDTGYGRTGLHWDRPDEIAAVAGELETPPVGLLVHAGHSYAARGAGQLEAVWNETVEHLHTARGALADLVPGEELLLSVGDTPTCSAVSGFNGVDEVRPGNFVFNDLMQHQIGSCDPRDLAAAVACPIVGRYPQRGRLVVRGGAVHLSKESLDEPGGRRIFGRLGRAGGGSLGSVVDEAPLVALSQEHGVIELARGDFDTIAGDLTVGDLVLVYPVHSCLSCDLHREFVTCDGGRLAR